MSASASFLEDLIDACVMEYDAREHMAERDLLFHDTLVPHLAAYGFCSRSGAGQRNSVSYAESPCVM